MTHNQTTDAVEVHFGTTKEGNWVAATCASPYFFFEVGSQAEAHAYAEDATRLYFENRDNIASESSNQGQAFQHPTLTNVSSELMYA